MNGHLFEEAQDPTVAEVVLADQGENGDTYDDGVDTLHGRDVEGEVLLRDDVHKLKDES